MSLPAHALRCLFLTWCAKNAARLLLLEPAGRCCIAGEDVQSTLPGRAWASALELLERAPATCRMLRGLTAGQRQALTRKALVYLGMKFGWAKLVTHVLDSLMNKVAHKEVFFFRRLNHRDRYPICSWITAFAYERSLHYRFGVPPECADPDQMHDWVEAHCMKWTIIFRSCATADK